ncbi:MAG: Gfo/Idh/MocA family oxidoreductase [Candidatus Hydrogenedentes bacterium]|nr:Gfo/Idh/MocA family oxidoreductase [Candidatus Hydrogenedentota bacterium]
MKTWRIAGINFDHLHMGDNLRMAFNHPQVEIAGICDERPERMQSSIENFSIPADRVFTDYRACIEKTKPDIVLLCPATAKHGEWTEKVAPFGVNVIMEKPFAASLAEADRMVAAMAKTRKTLAINWPLAWVASHRTAKRIIDEGIIGHILEVHYYDGNRGPLYHVADKLETTAEEMQREKPGSWFYKKDHGGGSLLDYLGYGTTLGTWFHGGKKPIEVTCVVDEPAGLEVDEHSITVARYADGLSKFETRWGTFTDPWTHQPQPKCGFVIKGAEGTISSYDYERTVRVQTRECAEGRDVPVDVLEPPFENPVQYVIHHLESGTAVEGPLSPEVSRIGQQIVDSAILSAREKRTVPLLA